VEDGEGELGMLHSQADVALCPDGMPAEKHVVAEIVTPAAIVWAGGDELFVVQSAPGVDREASLLRPAQPSGDLPLTVIMGLGAGGEGERALADQLGKVCTRVAVDVRAELGEDGLVASSTPPCGREDDFSVRSGLQDGGKSTHRLNGETT
jgi:hypothetical protein